jgi:hypothetical protein
MLGEDGYANLFPDAKPGDQLQWSRYREVIFDYLASRMMPQWPDWPGSILTRLSGHVTPNRTRRCPTGAARGGWADRLVRR